MAALSCLALLLAACGGGGGDPVATAPGDEATAVEVVDKAVLPVAPVLPLARTGVPDVNAMGLLQGTATWPKVTNVYAGQVTELRQLGKALFWDMQVGGDGIQSCASCHYHAGADNRKANQVSPGFKGGDWRVDLPEGLNATLTTAHYRPRQPRPGFANSEAAKIAAGATPDAADGVPGSVGDIEGGRKPAPGVDLNDVGSSQGVRAGRYEGLSGRSDAARLDATDTGFTHAFTDATFGTVRRVEPRNSPSVLNTVYNLRNFWDGRADTYFNGVNPLGFRDPDARVRAYDAAGGTVVEQKLLIPFSSLASQAVGPLGSTFEMSYDRRPLRDLGRKLTDPATTPLAGQAVASDDDLLGALRHGSGRGLDARYATMIRRIFDPKYWGYRAGSLDIDVCVDANGTHKGDTSAAPCDPADYTLMQYNFPLFFGLAVQAYEATLFTEKTLVDLVAGGVATGTLRNGRLSLNVQGVSLEGCVVGLASTARGAVDSGRLCGYHYASFVNDADMGAGGATSGSESATAPFPLPPLSPISGCVRGTAIPANPDAVVNRVDNAGTCERAFRTLMNVERGLGRWFAGATACSVCHLNAEFTGATVSTMTGFGAPAEVVPVGQLRRMERRAVMERMILANGAPAVYDTGFYNIGVRPTGEDLSLGDAIGGVPLSYAKILDIVASAGATAQAGNAPAVSNDANKVIRDVWPTMRTLQLPTSPTDLTPMPFPWAVGCGAGLAGGGNARGDGNPNATCLGTLVAGERLQRNGSFKTPGIRNAWFTGPYLHNGSKMNLRQVLEFYKTGGHFGALNLNNLDAGIRVVDVGPTDEAALVELMEVGLTDWRVAFQKGKFSHPEICVTHGHDPASGRSKVVGIPAVGAAGGARLQTYEEQLNGVTAGRANHLADPCTVTGVADAGAPAMLAIGLDLPPETSEGYVAP